VVVSELEETAVQSRRERVRQMMRQDILDAARRIIHEDGYKKLSMRVLARAVGVTAPTLYDYFSSKEAVLDALQLEGAVLFTAYLQDAVNNNEPGREQLRALGIAYRRFAKDHRDLFRLVVGRIDAAYEPGEEQMMRCSGVFDLVVRVVQDAMARGIVREDDPVAVATSMWAMAHGCVELELSGAFDCRDDQNADDVFNGNFLRLYEGIRPS
jgi:AcrR family transcriptional regulator